MHPPYPGLGLRRFGVKNVVRIAVVWAVLVYSMPSKGFDLAETEQSFFPSVWHVEEGRLIVSFPEGQTPTQVFELNLGACPEAEIGFHERHALWALLSLDCQTPTQSGIRTLQAQEPEYIIYDHTRRLVVKLGSASSYAPGVPRIQYDLQEGLLYVDTDPKKPEVKGYCIVSTDPRSSQQTQNLKRLSYPNCQEPCEKDVIYGQTVDQNVEIQDGLPLHENQSQND